MDTTSSSPTSEGSSSISRPSSTASTGPDVDNPSKSHHPAEIHPHSLDHKNSSHTTVVDAGQSGGYTEERHGYTGVQPDATIAQTWQSFTSSLLTKFPKFRQLVIYLRGPDPKIELDPPTAISNLYLPTFQGPRKSLRIPPFESYWNGLTRPFTSRFILVLITIGYIIAYSFFIRAQWFLTPVESFADCTSTYWLAKDGCGLDGSLCAPFTSSDPFVFRCPAGCSRTILANIRAVGDEEVAYVPLIVGGGDVNKTYRGDSWICPAAVHAGIISDSKGGCGTLSLIGDYTNFIGSISNGLESVGFPSVFPLSYTLAPGSLTHCTDMQNAALGFNVAITSLLFLILRPPSIFLFWSLICIGYFQLNFFSDTRGNPPPISDMLGDFLPTLFVGYSIWQLAFRHVLPVFKDRPIERALWYLPAFWVGALITIVFHKIPIDRLVGEDLKRPGAITALIILGILVLLIVINQMRVIRKTGWLPHYLKWYIIGACIVLILSQLPGLTLRLHHYIIGLMLLPGTAFPTRLSAIYQAFLLGMFLNGVARWGFASIVQTPAELLRDAPLGSSLPTFLTNSSSPLSVSGHTLTWMNVTSELAASEGWNGFSLLVDDVERLAGPVLNFSVAALQTGIPHFFRLAYQRDGASGDYTRAAIWWPNGTFTDPLPGPS